MDLFTLLRSSAFVWVHTKAEGFGRTLIEGRLLGRPVLASRLGVLRDQADAGTFFYRDAEDFVRQAQDLMTNVRPHRPYEGLRALQSAAAEGLAALCAT
jgi:glycosyltransferase involved in cell wall biosynthesis